MGNYLFVASVLSLSNGAVPLNQPTSILVTAKCGLDNTMPAPPTFILDCKTVTGPSVNVTLSHDFVIPDCSGPVNYTFTYPAQSVGVQVQCAFEAVETANPSAGPVGGVTYRPEEQKLLFRAGPQLGGSPFSLVTGGSTFIEPPNYYNSDSALGWTMEAWYRCAAPMPVLVSPSFTTASFPNGVFWSRTGLLGNESLIDFEFSHTPTQLCGTATRQYGSGNGVFESFRTCSVPFASTLGIWTHGAMTFDAVTGVIAFFQNGLPLATGSQTNSNATVIAEASTPRQAYYRTVGLAVRNEDPVTRDETYSYNPAGTAVDNLRLWGGAGTAAQVASNWNRPLNITEGLVPEGLVFYQLFHRTESTIYTQGYPQPFGLSWDVEEDFSYVNPISMPFRSCDRAGCGEPGTSGSDAPFIVVSSSSTAGNKASSSTGSATGAAAASSTGAATAAASSTAAGSSGSNNGAASSTAATPQGAASAVAPLSGWSMILAGAAVAFAQLAQ